VPSLVQWLPVRNGQLLVPHSPGPQITSHVQALLQVTLPHALLPVHVIWQIPFLLFPHVMSPQALLVAQVIVHAPASLQLIVSHAPPLEHVIVHAMPSGQSNELWGSVTAHVGGFAVVLQPPVQRLGQLGSSTQ